MNRSLESLSVQERIVSELARRELARRDFLEFANFTMDEFEPTWFHETYYKILNYFSLGMLKKLMVTIGPQNGKSEGSSRRLPAYMLGKNPNLKIGLASFNSSFAQKFSMDVQRIIVDYPYYNLFPETTLQSTEFSPDTRGKEYKKTQSLFEIVNHQGAMKSVGRGGALTGEKIDLMILDDLYKDYSEGNSPIVREAVINWYLSVVLKRLHNKSQQLIVFTRWHEEDLIGYLEKKTKVKTLESWKDLEYFIDNPQVWCKINFPTLKIGEPTELDPREPGEAIWPNRHSREDKEAEREMDEEKFDSLEQGDPKPKRGLLYQKGFNLYKIRPSYFREIKNYTDSADEGTDYLCSICYGVGTDNKIYILDVLYTQAPQEETEPLTAELLSMNKVTFADFESNNGGKGFARSVDRLLNRKIIIEWFHQSGNKESRIITNAPACMRYILFPENWTTMWPEFSRDLLRFRKNFKSNKHNDGPDALTGVLEYSGLLTEVNDALNSW